MALENVRLFEALQASTQELGEANQAKSRFIAAASHDLRQPLHAWVYSSAVCTGP